LAEKFNSDNLLSLGVGNSLLVSGWRVSRHRHATIGIYTASPYRRPAAEHPGD
jgi:hypothetical protein